jgi:hypothetical protein
MKDANRLIHEELQVKVRALFDEEKGLRNIIYQILTEGSAYLIGGYVRDVFEGVKSRDLDIIVDIKKERLKEIVDSDSFCKEFNRFGGVKLRLPSIEVDIWNFDSNWAFKNKLVKLNEKEKLNSLAKGCFFNFDALVVNLSKFTYNTKFYENFLDERKLDILQKRSIYKNLNPTVEANILRAIYIKEKYGVLFTTHLKEYIYKKMQFLNDVYGNVVDRLIAVKATYPKYQMVSVEDIINTYEELRLEMPQSLFD